MIRPCQNSDIDAVLDIWLDASIQAHDFVEPGVWESQLESMRDIYLPASENHVYDQNPGIAGFYALHGDTLAAIFVAPTLQGRGIGKQLLAHAKQQRTSLTLSVYQANDPSYRFYLSQGFRVTSEQADTHTGHPEYTMTWTGAETRPIA
ncbi:N-acetyltransferase [Parahaliea mediterranea]|uniref:N-acetyltransferase n=1 Tax=Parahaliea mediterranea TaxID=651086 RepID=A0A939DCY0_9GAMM|nr:N-acetyltransferase [Parahaliea mediterranea]